MPTLGWPSTAVLAQVYRGGEVDRIFERWFGDDAEPTQLLEERPLFHLNGFAD